MRLKMILLRFIYFLIIETQLKYIIIFLLTNINFSCLDVFQLCHIGARKLILSLYVFKNFVRQLKINLV